MNISNEVWQKLITLLYLLSKADTQGACDVGGFLDEATTLAMEIEKDLGIG